MVRVSLAEFPDFETARKCHNSEEYIEARKHLENNVIRDHNGSVFGGAGDSLIAEFASPVKATECAVQMQLKMDDTNSILNFDYMDIIYN